MDPRADDWRLMDAAANELDLQHRETTMAEREAWQRGPIDGVSPQLQPAAHAFMHAREDLARILPAIDSDMLWHAPGDAASIGWHLLHLSGSTGRLLSYARGEALTEAQWAWLEREKQPPVDLGLDQLMRHVEDTFDAAIAQLRGTRDDELDEIRGVGRARLPVTVRGLLFHAGEHASRHAGQVITTIRLLRQGRSA